jgi:hypothetical protein
VRFLRDTKEEGLKKKGDKKYYYIGSNHEFGGGMKGKVVIVNARVLRFSVSALCLLALVLALACSGKKEVKQVSPESKLTLEAFSVAEGVRAAYVRKDFPAIKEISTADGYREIIDSIKHFDSVELTFTPKWVEIDKSLVQLNVAWKGTWTVEGETDAERGMAVFLFEGQPLKFSKVLRGNPFKYPER